MSFSYSRKVSKQTNHLTAGPVNLFVYFTYINIFFSTIKSSIAGMLLKHWLVVRKNIAPTLQKAKQQAVII